MIGQAVLLYPPDGGEISAEVLDISEDGRLLAELENGETLFFSCGDVKLRMDHHKKQ